MSDFDSDDEQYFFNFAKLNGDNMRIWYRHMETSLKALGLWEVADPDAEADEEAELQEAKRAGKPAHPSSDQARLLLILYRMCEPYLTWRFEEVETGRAALRVLLKAYRKFDFACRIIAFEQFLSLKMTQDQSIMDWCTSVIVAADEYQWTGGRKLEKLELVAKFRDGLCDQFKETSHLLALQDISKPNEEPDVFDFAVKLRDSIEAQTRRWPQQASESSNPPFPPKNPAHKYTVCQRCAKIGHIAIDCRSQVEGMATSEQVQRSEKRAARRREKEEGSHRVAS